MLKDKKNHVVNKEQITLENIIVLCAYISIPLVMLLVATFASSYLTTGGMNTDVNNAKNLYEVLLSFSVPMLVTLGVLPLLAERYIGKTSFRTLGLYINNKKMLIITLGISAVIIGILSYVFNKGNSDVSTKMIVIHFFFVAVSEEIMLRSVVMHETSKVFKGLLNCIINGLIFAFIYHSNSDFLSNLIIRFPLGVILASVRWKSKSIYPSIMLHWIYNVLVVTI